MKHSILLVDDDPHILNGYRRRLKRNYDVHTAEGPAEGLIKINSGHAFALVLSDMKMPKMSGVEFLQIVKKSHPDIVRVMLTGNADQQTAMDAVNEGAIFRFLTKPCDTERMTETLNDATRQYELQLAERELLQKTVRGSIKMLVDVLSIAEPEAFGRSMKLKDRLVETCRALSIPCDWTLELAAMLSDLGVVTLPVPIRQKLAEGKLLKPSESAFVKQVPETTQHLIANIPRLEPVAELLRYQSIKFSDDPAMPVEARLLCLMIDMARLEAQGSTSVEACTKLRDQEDKYDLQILDKILANLVQSPEAKPVEIPVSSVNIGHIIAEDVTTTDDRLLVRAGQCVTEAIQIALINYVRYETIDDRVVVLEAA